MTPIASGCGRQMDSGPGSGRDRIPRAFPARMGGGAAPAGAKQEETMASKTRQTTKTRRRTKNAPVSQVNNEQHRYIAEAAYYRAERRGFVPGFEELDWLEAEREVASSLTSR